MAIKNIPVTLADNEQQVGGWRIEIENAGGEVRVTASVGDAKALIVETFKPADFSPGNRVVVRDAVRAILAGVRNRQVV